MTVAVGRGEAIWGHLAYVPLVGVPGWGKRRTRADASVVQTDANRVQIWTAFTSLRTAWLICARPLG
jgi:hypothetical protein